MGVLKAIPFDISGNRVTICSDSESTIKALTSPVTTSELMKECKETFNHSGLRNQITMIWVPEHSGVDGNEKADELARRGSAAVCYGPEPFILIP